MRIFVAEIFEPMSNCPGGTVPTITANGTTPAAKTSVTIVSW